MPFAVYDRLKLKRNVSSRRSLNRCVASTVEYWLRDLLSVRTRLRPSGTLTLPLSYV